MDTNVIYLDNNATTQVDERVLQTMLPFLKSNYANANSTHLFGVEANEAIKNARKQTSKIIGAEPHEIIFTSGSTEAINIAIKGVAENYSHKGKHIVTVSTEHKAVLDTCYDLVSKGFEVTFLDVQEDGLLDLERIKSTIRTDTILVSVMLVNNETGVVQPIGEISKIAHENGAIFMTDATQAIGKIGVNVDELRIDLLCFSGHKIYAPKGVGALYIRQRNNKIKIPALIHGGGHERGVRSGTLNVPGIVALGKACELAIDEMETNHKIADLRDDLEENLLKIKNTSINGNCKNRIGNTTNIRFDNVDSEALIMGLSSAIPNTIIAVSSGSACTAHDIKPSHVLTSMGLSENEAFNSIRFSFGKYNTKEEVEIVVNQINKIVENLRSMNV